LAEAGARVIKIERPEGDFARNYDHMVRGQSAYFVWLNRGKESVCLDLHNPSSKQVLDNMLGKADIFIQNLAPGLSSDWVMPLSICVPIILHLSVFQFLDTVMEGQCIT